LMLSLFLWAPLLPSLGIGGDGRRAAMERMG
jgi:hypothetical protein